MVELFPLRIAHHSSFETTNCYYEIRTAVTPNRASNTAAEWNVRDFKSLCKGPTCISETVQDSYNSGPFKNRISSSSGGHYHQSCHVTKACASASTDINADKLAEFFVEKVKGCVPLPYLRHECLQLCNFWEVSTFKPPLRKCGTCCRVRLSRVPLSTRCWRSSNVSWSTSHQRSVTHQVQDCADGIWLH